MTNPEILIEQIYAVRVREVVGYPGYYISDSGRVFSVQLVNGDPGPREIKHYKNRDGRPLFAAHKGGKRYNLTVHRAVAMAWIGLPPDESYEVCHNNGDMADNRVSNLRWDTHKNNCADRNLHGTHIRGARNGRAKLTPEQVDRIRAQFQARKGRKWGANDLARDFGVTATTICLVAHGVTWVPHD